MTTTPEDHPMTPAPWDPFSCTCKHGDCDRCSEFDYYVRMAAEGTPEQQAEADAWLRAADPGKGL